MGLANRRRRLVFLGVLACASVGCGAPASDGEVDDAASAVGADETSQGDRTFGELSPEAPPETGQWGQLAGAWDCTIRSIGSDGIARESNAVWTWRYILGGHAVQDVYVGLNEAGEPSFRGTGLRVYNPWKGLWEITWAASSGPNQDGDSFSTYVATYELDQIVMRYADGDSTWRTTFHDIEEDAFEWRNEPSRSRMRCERATESQG
jgi:hypothetical protein